MASVDAIARIRENAVEKISKTASKLAVLLEIETLPELPFNRDPAYKHAVQLEAIADYLAGVEKAANVRLKKLSAELQAAKAALETKNEQAEKPDLNALPPGAATVLAAHPANKKKA